MNAPNKTQIWLAQTRANFLLLAVLLVAIGTALAYAFTEPGSRGWNWLDIALITVGVIASHISVNLFNEYSDFNTKIDFNTLHNPFSGGSKMLVQGFTTPTAVLRMAIITLVIALLIGAYYVYASHWSLLFFILIGGFSIVLYTDLLAKYLMGELFSGLALGTMVVLGTYIALTTNWYMPIWDILPLEVILISIPPGILTSLLLLLNEFPDAEADKAGGRHHVVIRFGKKGAAYIYVAGLILTFGTIAAIVVLGLFSPWMLIALLPLPLAFKTGMTALKYGTENDKIIPAMGMNVMMILGTDLLLTIGVLL